MTRGVKADKITYEQRVNQVLSLIHRGWDSAKIVPNISSAWNVTDRQARGYVQSARTRIAKLYEHKRRHMVSEILARHDDLRDKGYANADYGLVLDTDKEDAKLLGLYAPERHEVNLSGDALDAAIERELARLAGAGEAGAAGEDSEPQRGE